MLRPICSVNDIPRTDKRDIRHILFGSLYILDVGFRSILFLKFNLGLSANRLLTILQPICCLCSLNLVNVNALQELQNVLPKCNQFPPQFRYDDRRAVGVHYVVPYFTFRTLTTISAHNQHKNPQVDLPLVLLFV
jgi:hypothetical protein